MLEFDVPLLNKTYRTNKTHFSMSVKIEEQPIEVGTSSLPPSSQPHFSKFENFTPDEAAPFQDEFNRLASSQYWVPGSQEYTRQRTIAMREELNRHYFPPSQPLRQIKEEESSQPLREIEGEEPSQPLRQIKEEESPQPSREIEEVELTPEEILNGYQTLCRQVGIPPAASTGECKKALKKNLVNIVDFIDAKRTGKEVKIWTDFHAFRVYTLEPNRRIELAEAKAGYGFLASLLQNLVLGPRRPFGRRTAKPRPVSGVFSGRVTKQRPSALR